MRFSLHSPSGRQSGAGLAFAFLIGLSCMAQTDGSIAQIVSGGDFHQRLATVHQLPNHLPHEALRSLQHFLREPSGEPGEAALKNDLLNVLRAQAKPPAGLSETLLNIFRDRRHSPLMRDYAIQHLGAWYPLAPDKQGIQETLWQACDQTGTSIAGTALLALHRLAGRYQGVDLERLAQTALEVARHGDSALSKLTALRICGERNQFQARDIARDILRSPGDISLQLAAVATLGEVGQADDKPLLEKFLAHPRLAHAAEQALNRLKNALGEV